MRRPERFRAGCRGQGPDRGPAGQRVGELALQAAPGDETGRRLGDAGSDPAREVALDPRLDLVRAAVALEAVEVEAETLGPAPRGAGRRPGRGRSAASPRSPRTRPPNAGTRPRPRRAGPAIAGACWRSGSGGRRAAAEACDPGPGAGAPRTGEVEVDDGRRAPRRERGRRADRARGAAALPSGAEGCLGHALSPSASSASKIRFAPGISSGVSAPRATRRRCPSPSIRTSERLACPRSARSGAVGVADLALGMEVGEQRDREAELLAERRVAERRVDADPDQGGVRGPRSRPGPPGRSRAGRCRPG